MPSAPYDAIVVGAGGVGSAAMWQLACRGLRVLGVDRFAPPHDRGSSHGQTRIIRQAYFEHADYVPLLIESYRLWELLEERSGRRLKQETGLIEIGRTDGVVVPGVLRAAAEHGLKTELLTARELETRWPAFRVPEGFVGVFERRAGLLWVEDCVAACLEEARREGAELVTQVEVFGWEAKDDIVVHTSGGDFHTGRLIVAAGAWAGELLASLGLDWQVRRKILTWHASADDSMDAAAGFPCYLFELPEGIFYGFPQIDRRGLKVGEHSGGERVGDPLEVDRSLRDADRRPVEAFLKAHLPAAKTPCREYAVCLYTMTPDEHFVVDRRPDDPRIAFAAGLSGHGFKFTPVLGKVLADLVIDGATNLPIGFLSLGRFNRATCADRSG